MEEKISTLIEGYQPSSEAVEVLSLSPTLLVVGISGAGKNTIMHRLIRSGIYHDVITHTTRVPRPGEKDDLDYHFIDKPTALRMLENHEYIEANQYTNNVYGTSIAEFRSAHQEHKLAVADIDVNGVAHFMRIAGSMTRPVFLLPPSYEIWLDRWRARYGDTYEQHKSDLELRLRTAVDELEHVLTVDYYYFVINDDLDEAVQRVDTIGRTGDRDPAAQAAGLELVHQLLSDMRKAQLS
jgi:guanylate kinase